ncbi:HEPN domain-containing protein [Pseudoalteromonas viridis]|uniref:RiboL-PSP-HEPN domain-containing protein n=1 Tax=Pseudoalteromonas viridis TaxID=339617 RepID=A0ABX7V379_9GAMM|nr:HEPN domain-containing protein [Pseudoalteromonas viridis]QTL34935.1 hypothetical protein J5X90_15585 [Pseudoalteromonas viridis]
MNNSISQFRENIHRARHLGGLYSALESLTTELIDSSDILRSQIVLSVSALDHYVHEVTVEGMLEVYKGNRQPTNSYLKYQVSTSSLMLAKTTMNMESIFEEEIRQKHSYLSFQYPDKVADAIRLFSGCKLWEEVGVILNLSARDTKDKLKLIVDRRNKIAHEADIDPSYPGMRWPITVNDANQATDFIEQLCESIHSIVF